MRPRSLTGPLIAACFIGGLVPVEESASGNTGVRAASRTYWPFLLIGWGLLRLIEVAFSQREQRRGGFSGGEVVLVILICMRRLPGMGGPRARHPLRRRRPGLVGLVVRLSGVGAARRQPGMKRIVFENPRGSIKVTGADTNEVTVTGTQDRSAPTPASDADRTNRQHAAGDRAAGRPPADPHQPGSCARATSGSPTTWK